MKSYIQGSVGNFYLKIFKLEKAITFLKKAVENNTKNVLAIYNFSIINLQNGNAEKALECLETARKLNKKVLYEKLIILGMSSCYWKLNELDKAIEILEELRNNYEYISPDALATLGYFYILKKDYEKAMDLSKKALNENQVYSSAWDNIGQIYFFQKDYENAKTNFLKSIECNPNSVDSLYYLGLLEEINNNNQEAEKYFNQALNCRITALNTISNKDLEEKINKYKLK